MTNSIPFNKIFNENSIHIKQEKPEFQLEEALIILNDMGYYQIRTLILLSFLWGLSPVVPVLLPFFTVEPIYLCRLITGFNINFIICEGDQKCDNNYEVMIDPNNELNTWIHDFKLSCSNKYLIFLIGSAYFIGMILGNLILPKFCETYGRKLNLLINMILYICNNTFILFIRFNLYLIIYSLISGIVYSGTSLSAFVLNFEYSTKFSKNIFSTVINSSYSIGAIFQILIFYLFNDWRINISVNVTLYIFLIINHRKIYESPTYLLNSNPLELKKILIEISHLNKKSLSFSIYMEKTNLTLKTELNTNNYKPNGMFSILLSKKDLRKLILIATSWLSVSIITYGTSLNLRKYGSDLTLIGITYYLSNSISTLLSSILLQKFGFKKASIIYYSLCLISNLILVFKSGQQSILVKLLLFISGFSSSAIGSLNYIYTADLFSCDSRISALSFCSLVNRIGGILSSFITQMSFPTLIFSFLSAMSISSIYKIE